MWLGQMTLDPVSGAIVSGELNRLEHDLFEGQLRQAKNAPGAPGSPRRAGPHLGAAPGRRPRRDGRRSASAPRLTASAPPRSFLSSSATKHSTDASPNSRTARCSPSALTPWMDSAYFERAIFSLGNRVDVSVRARLFNGGTREYRAARPHLHAPYCYEPPKAPETTTSRPGPRVERPPERTGACSAAPQPPAQPAPTPAPAPAAPTAAAGGRRAPRRVTRRSMWPGADETRSHSALRRARDGVHMRLGTQRLFDPDIRLRHARCVRGRSSNCPGPGTYRSSRCRRRSTRRWAVSSRVGES